MCAVGEGLDAASAVWSLTAACGAEAPKTTGCSGGAAGTVASGDAVFVVKDVGAEDKAVCHAGPVIAAGSGEISADSTAGTAAFGATSLQSDVGVAAGETVWQAVLPSGGVLYCFCEEPNPARQRMGGMPPTPSRSRHMG